MTPQTVEVEDGDWAVGLSDESEAEDSIKRDPDWVETPFSPGSPDTPMVPRQRRSGRRTRSTEASLVKNTGRAQVCEEFALHIDEEKLQSFWLLFQNTPGLSITMFESCLLIPDCSTCSFCGNRMKINK